MATLTTAGKALLAALANGYGSPAAATYMAYGSGTTAESVGQTILVTETARAAATCTSAAAVTSWVKAFTTGTSTIAECGIFNDVTTGTMLIRHKLATARTAVTGDTWTGTVTLTFS